MGFLGGSRVRCRLALMGVLGALTLLAVAGPIPVARAATAASEYQVKAVFLFNFAQFVEWPPAAFQDAETPLVIGVVGSDPFGAYLDEVVRGEQVKGRALVVKRFRTLEDVDVCHILFVSPADAPRLASGPSVLGGRAILTVSDAERAARPGAMIQFVEARKHIRLRIAVDTASAAGLTISSKLLRSAEIVRGTGG